MDLKCSMGVSHSLITLLLLQVPPLLTPFLTTLDTNWIRENSSLILKPIFGTLTLLLINKTGKKDH